jgi:hypothetical protein
MHVKQVHTYNILVKEPQWKKALVRSRNRRKGNIKMDTAEIGKA